jgi:hypothetical protein
MTRALEQRVQEVWHNLNDPNIAVQSGFQGKLS